MVRPDVWIVAAATPLVAAALAFGAWHAAAEAPARGEARRFTAGGDVPTAPAAAPGDPNPFLPAQPFDPLASPLANVKITAAEGTELVPWDRLKTYEYQPGLAGLPEDLRSLDGRRVTMAGFLLPLYEFEDIREFALVGNHWSCCFGQPPTLNGVVTVKLKAGEDGLPNTAEPLRVVGTFRAKETKESGYVVSIFSIPDATVSVIPY